MSRGCITLFKPRVLTSLCMNTFWWYWYLASENHRSERMKEGKIKEWLNEGSKRRKAGKKNDRPTDEKTEWKKYSERLSEPISLSGSFENRSVQRSHFCNSHHHSTQNRNLSARSCPDFSRPGTHPTSAADGTGTTTGAEGYLERGWLSLWIHFSLFWYSLRFSLWASCDKRTLST